MAIFLLLLFGAFLIGGPVAAGIIGHPLGLMANLTLLGFGSVLIFFSLFAIIITRLFVKVKADEALVKTGQGGKKVILDGGTFFVSFVHELIRVPLRSLKLEVAAENEKAMVTADKLRADIKAEFFVRVKPDEANIIQAATTMGDKLARPEEVTHLIEDKLVSAFRTVAAKMTLDELNTNRESFIMEVEKILGKDLAENGLFLETVTISKLDQTDEVHLKDTNIFDAQGRKKIAEVTQQNLTERNRLVREGEQARKEQDVNTQKNLLAFEQDQAFATARQASEVAKVKADTEREAREAAIVAQRQVELAEVDKSKMLEVAAQKQQETVAVAQEQKQQAIASAAGKRAKEEEILATAQALREKASQQIETVKITEAAEREKKKTVITAEAAAESKLVAAQKDADASAYKIERDAEARKKSADADALAVTKKAEASSAAQKMEAQGIEAIQMVPVKVDQERVKIDQNRVENVIKPELQARQEFGKEAQDFEIRKLSVEAEKQVRIAAANASATIFTKMTAQLYGTPEDAGKIISAVMNGQGMSSAIEGFLQTAGPQTKDALSKIGSVTAGVADAISDRLKENGSGTPAALPSKEQKPPSAQV